MVQHVPVRMLDVRCYCTVAAAACCSDRTKALLESIRDCLTREPQKKFRLVSRRGVNAPGGSRRTAETVQGAGRTAAQLQQVSAAIIVALLALPVTKLKPCEKSPDISWQGLHPFFRNQGAASNSVSLASRLNSIIQLYRDISLRF